MDKQTFESSSTSNIKNQGQEANNSRDNSEVIEQRTNSSANNEGYGLGYDDRDDSKSVHTLDRKNRFSDLETAILVKDLDLYYGDFQALKRVNMDIKKGQVTAFIGPSGCGKSTFLRTLNRMNDTIDSCRVTGKVMLDNQDIYDPNLDVVLLRAQVGMVFQKPNPFPKSIFENVAYGPKLHGLARDKYDLEEIVENSLRKAGLWDEVKDRLNQPGTGLSGGQQQRLCIARTIAVSPEVILMDEPCSALDPIATAKVEELISELSTQYTIAIVTHSMQQAARVSDRTAYFHLGDLIEVNATEKVFTQPDHQLTEAYITGRFG